MSFDILENFTTPFAHVQTHTLRKLADGLTELRPQREHVPPLKTISTHHHLQTMLVNPMVRT
jgi:hypothetical protein